LLIRPAVIIVRLVVWSALAAGVIGLLPESRGPSSFEAVRASGLTLIRRSVEGASWSVRPVRLEIYLPRRDTVWHPGSGGEQPTTPGLEQIETTAGPSSGLVAEVHRRHPRPAVIAIHGGSWMGGSARLYQLDPDNTIQRLARAGLVVVVPDYRLARPGNPSWPAVLDQMREVVRWVRRHAEELEVDPRRIAAMGQSAGGLLAALLGTVPDKPGDDGVSARVNAVIDFYGPSDLMRLVETRRLAHEPARVFLGPAADGRPVPFAGASPIEHVTRDAAPMLLLHGSDDAWVDPEQSARLAQALRRAGVRHQLIVVDGARHGFEAQVNTVPRRDLLPEILGFLKSVWEPGG
jgi:acetyl esterase/lipase